jgi:hypothetical protein
VLRRCGCLKAGYTGCECRGVAGAGYERLTHARDGFNPKGFGGQLPPVAPGRVLALASTEMSSSDSMKRFRSLEEVWCCAVVGWQYYCCSSTLRGAVSTDTIVCAQPTQMAWCARRALVTSLLWIH